MQQFIQAKQIRCLTVTFDGYSQGEIDYFANNYGRET